MAKEDPIKIWRRKLGELQRQEVIAADPNLKFQLQEQIRDAEEQIAKLAGGPRHAPNADLPAVVPQGLDSFGEDDKDFFLRLLPGPYRDNGLPESLHFWKRQIEQTDADETFRVGVIYGRSGCGKSSWIKAGLLPRLEGVTSVYVEAIPDGTPQRLLAALRKRCPWLGDAASLAELLQRTDRIPLSTKVLIVLDQFEQWLHGRLEEDYGELRDALDSCDGARVQCVLLIRDGFWGLLTRFLQRLGVRQEEGKNLAMFDLFDKRHARKVLTLFGEAYGALLQSGERSPDQEAFLDQAVDGLAEDGRIVCVQLSLFAEMLKGREWTPSTLRKIGGTSWVGFAFLEEHFTAKDAKLTHRRQADAAQAVLECLLPPVGVAIKGAMRSEDELKSRSGYAKCPEEFTNLLQILNEQLRLITPSTLVEDGGADDAPDVDTPNSVSSDGKYYQLTHDFLVPSLRKWVDAKPRSYRGRAHRRLVRLSETWNANEVNRFLPALWELLNILCVPKSHVWTESQRRMMRQAAKYHCTRAAVLTALLLFSMLGIYWWNVRTNVQVIVDSLRVAGPDEILPLVDRLKASQNFFGSDRGTPLLVEWLESESDPKKQLAARLALLADDADQVDTLAQQLLVTSDVAYLDVISKGLAQRSERSCLLLWEKLHDQHLDRLQRFRAGVGLARSASIDDPLWTDADAKLLVTELLRTNPEHQPRLRDMLRPIRERLFSPAKAAFSNVELPESEQVAAANLVADYLRDDVVSLSQLMALANVGQQSILYPLLEATNNPGLNGLLRGFLEEKPSPQWNAAQRLMLGRRKANAALTLLRLGDREAALEALRVNDDPESLTQFAHLARQWSIPSPALLKCIEQVHTDRKDMQGHEARMADRVLFGLLLALREYDLTDLPPAEREARADQFGQWYREDPSSAIHGAIGSLLRRWERTDEVELVDHQRLPYDPLREWFIEEIKTQSTDGQSDTQYFTFIVFQPGESKMGSPESEKFREHEERRHNVRLTTAFAICDREITNRQFGRFFGKERSEDYREKSLADDDPAIRLSWNQAVSYCRWLTRQAGKDESEQCYSDPEGQELGKDGFPQNWTFDFSKAGFRIPTEAEWEFACRAGTITPYSFGSDWHLLEHYAWFLDSAPGTTQPVGKKLPNLRGLFDVHGNVWEWCHDWFGPYEDTAMDPSGSTAGNERVVRGGSWYDDYRRACRSAYRYRMDPANSNNNGTGLRLCVRVFPDATP